MAAARLSTIISCTLVFIIILTLHSPSALAVHRSLLVSNNNDDGELYDLDMQELGLEKAEDIRVFTSGDSGKISSDNNNKSSSKELTQTLSSSSSCEATYGVMPCTESVVGNLFLMAAYGFLLFLSAKMLSEGSELLLTVLNAGIIGGLLLPILGALPDSILILVSGLGGTQSEAQEQVLVGIGLLAGSTVMLLTLLWGSCLILGRCDLEVDENTGKTKAVNKKLSKPFGLTDTGVEIDDLTRLSARIMIISVVPYIVAELPRIFGFSANGNIPVLIAFVLSFTGLLGYCLYQVFTPWLQQRRKEIARRRVLKVDIIEKLRKRGGVEKLVDDKGCLNKELAERLFKLIDRNNDGIVNCDELRAMLSVSMRHGHGQGTEEIITHFMDEFDENKNKSISMDEFLKGMQKWPSELQRVEDDDEDDDDEEEEDDDDEAKNKPLSRGQIIRKAVLLLLGGTILTAVFADPLVDAVEEFSSASQIPSFFVSFILLPLASNSSEGVSSIMFSAGKKKKTMSLTYSQIYGAVTMNSTMGLGIFLALVYARQLVWDFSSEVLVIGLVTVIMGLLASFRKVFPLWMAGIALLLYPLSLGLVAVLDYVAGWQ